MEHQPNARGYNKDGGTRRDQLQGQSKANVRSNNVAITKSWNSNRIEKRQERINGMWANMQIESRSTLKKRIKGRKRREDSSIELRRNLKMNSKADQWHPISQRRIENKWKTLPFPMGGNSNRLHQSNTVEKQQHPKKKENGPRSTRNRNESAKQTRGPIRGTRSLRPT